MKIMLMVFYKQIKEVKSIDAFAMLFQSKVSRDKGYLSTRSVGGVCLIASP